MIDLGTVRPGSTIRIPFSTFDKDDGSSITMTSYAAADMLVYKDGGTTERASTAGFTATTDFDAKTGKHLAIIDLADNTTAAFWNAGSEYLVAIDAVTVDAVTTGGWIARFRIGYVGSLIDTTIATLSSQTSMTLTVGPAEDNALVGFWAVIHDIASAVQLSKVLISAYTGSTRTITLAAGATFTAAAGDNISVMDLAPLQPGTVGRTLVVDAAGLADANAVKIGPTGSGTAQTARDIGASVLLSSGTGTGQVTLTSGRVNADLTHIAAAAVSTSTAQLGVNVVNFGGSAGTFASGRPEVNASHAAGTAWNSGAIGAATLAADTITDAKVASDVTIASVTGAVGSVTGAVGSVTGNVGGNVVGSVASVTGNVGGSVASVVGAVGSVTGAVGSVATGGITEASFATTAGAFAPLSIVDQGTAQSATGTTLVLRSAAAFADSELVGARILITGGSAGVGQSRVITGYVSSSDTATVDAWTTTPTGTITYKVFAAAPALATPASVNVVQISGDATAADNAEAFFDGTGYAGTNNVIPTVTTVNGLGANVITAAATAADFGTEVGTAVWATTTRVLTAGTNIALAKGTGVTGFNDLDAAGVRSAVGLASANLDTQLAAIDDFLDTEVAAIKTVTDRLGTTVESVGSPGDYVFTAAALAQGPSGGGGLTAAAIADAVWEEAIADHSGTSGGTAEALSAAGASGDPWITALPGSYTAGQAGYIMGTNLNATVSSRATQSSLDTVDGIVDSILVDTAEIGAAGAGLTVLATAAALAVVDGNVDSILEDTADMQPKLGTPAGASMSADIAAVKTQTAAIETDTQDIQTRLPAALVSGRMDSSVGAMAANVMTAAAAASDLTTELQSGLATASALSTVSSNVSAVKVVTDKLGSTVESVGSPGDFVFTAAALSQAPSSAAAIAALEAKLDIVDANVDAILLDTGTDGVVVASASKNGYRLSSTGVDDVLDEVVEGATTLRESVRLANSALGGKASGLETTTAVYRDLADSKDRLTAVVDADGNRTSVTRDLT